MMNYHIADDGDAGAVGSEDVVTILAVRDDGRLRYVDVDVLEEPGSVTEIQHDRSVTILWDPVRFNTHSPRHLINHQSRSLLALG